MPRIPTPANQGAQQIGGQQTTVDPRTPQQSFSVPSFEGPTQALFEQVSRGAENVASFANELQEQEDERNLLELQNEFKERKREIEFGQDGIFRRKGKNAVGATEDAEQRAREVEQDLMARHSFSPEARQTAEAWLQRQRNSTAAQAARHELTEREQYQTELTNNAIESSIEEGARFYNSPQKIAAAEGRIRDQAKTAAERRGMSDEAAKEFVEGNVSALYRGTIDRALANREYGKAEAMLQEYRKEGKLEGDQLAAVEKQVNAGVVERDGFNLAEAALAQSGVNNLSGMLRYVRQNAPNARVREYAVSEVKTRFNEQQNIRQHQQQQAYERLSEKADDGTLPSEAEMEQADLTIQQRNSLRKQAQNRRQQIANPSWSRPTEQETVDDYAQFAARGDQQFAQISYSDFKARFREGLSQQAWETARAKWKNVNAEMNTAAWQNAQDQLQGGLDVQTLSETKQLESIALANDIDPNDDVEEYADLVTAYDRRVRNWALANNKSEVPSDVRAQIRKDLVTEKFDYNKIGSVAGVNVGTNPDDDLAFRLDAERIAEFGEEMGYSQEEVARAQDELPTVTDSLYFAGRAVSRENVDGVFRLADIVSPDNRRLFYENYPTVVNWLRQNNKRVTDQNIINFWNANEDKFR